MPSLTVALTGNPNTGKSTIFNELTGAHQKTGNWPGVTVDKKEGYVNYEGYDISVVDLPGTYSISTRSAEEQVVIDYFQHNTPDIVLNVVDSSNIERNLFLTLQLLEMGIPLLIDFNMKDEAKKRGMSLNMHAMEQLLGMPVVETIGRSNKTTQELLDLFISIDMKNVYPSSMLKEYIGSIETIRNSNKQAHLIEEDVISARYAMIDRIVEKTVVFSETEASCSEKIDRYLANGMFAPIIFFLILYAVFQITFSWIGQPITEALDHLICVSFAGHAGDFLYSAGVSDWLRSLLVDGIISGVGAVVSFVPLIFVLFFCLSFLDGTGYMARVAFIADPFMRRFGLTGKGIMPLMLGFGCAVPSIMGARALDSEKDRIISMLVAPFLTCGAKLPVMALLAAVFFPAHAANVVFCMYLLGFIVAIFAAKLLGVTLLKNDTAAFLLELPPYRMPDMKTVFLETWDKGKGFLVKAGTIIFVCSVLIWFLSKYNFHGFAAQMSESFLAFLGGGVSYLFVFHGFATWEAGAAIISGLFAKEVVVSTLGVLYGLADADTEKAAEQANLFLKSGIGTDFTALSAFSFMVFLQLYTPCVTALGTIKKEAGSWKWTGFSAVFSFLTAWVVSLLVYQIGKALGLG